MALIFKILVYNTKLGILFRKSFIRPGVHFQFDIHNIFRTGMHLEL